MQHYSPTEQERIMKVQEVILRAVAGRISWLEAADILRWSPRTMRRWRWRYEQYGYDGLYDRRKRRPSPKRVPLKLAERVLRLYRERYSTYNVKHFHEKLKEEHGIVLSYQWVKVALQMAGLVAKGTRHEKHRMRRERRPMKGMMLFVDGSTHHWLPEAKWRQDLILFLDDATSQVLSAYLVEEEGSGTVLSGLKEVIAKHGLFCSLYTDRGGHFFHTPKAGGPVDKGQLTQLGRVLAQLGIEHIPSYSPQARGRIERLFGTWQGRLPQELATAKIGSLEEANAYIKERFIPWHNRTLAVKAAEPGSAFVSCAHSDVEGILCLQEERQVGKDNTISYGKLRLQIGPVDWKCTLAGCQVKVCDHLDGRLSVRYGPHVLGWYDTERGTALGQLKKAA
jgi:transposase